MVETKVSSTLATQSLNAHPHRPLEASQARARRSLAAAAAARSGIATMVDALRVSKPPRAPQNPRRHALIPLAEGRDELEARIRALEDIVSTRDDEAHKLKRQLGRALVKRRYLERERENNNVSLTAATAAVKECYAGLVGARADLATLVDDVEASVSALRDVTEGSTENAVEDIVSALDIARAKLAQPPTEPVLDAMPAASIALGKVKPIKMGSTVGSDDDAKSCASYASSTAFGDDRETQVETLVELVEILDAKLSTGHPAEAVLARAKRTLAKEKGDIAEVMEERDHLKDVLGAVAADDDIGAANMARVKAEVELRATKKQMEEMKEKLAAVEKIAERAVKAEETMARNRALQAELLAAKKTVGRLAQERNSLRKTATLTNTPNSTSSRARPRDAEAMKRILDWQRSASSENHPPPIAQPAFDDTDVKNDRTQSSPGSNKPVVGEDGKQAFPDRVTALLSQKAPTGRRKLPLPDLDSVNVNDKNSVTGSVDVGASDSASAQSLSLHGFLRRNDSFLSIGGISASGDEITVTNNRNIFNSPMISTDGLRGLLARR